MRRLFLCLAVLAAAVLNAQTSETTQRHVFLTTALSPAEAASQVAEGSTQPLIPTGSDAVPYVSWTIVYCTTRVTCDPASGICSSTTCSLAPPPAAPIPVEWLEFSTRDLLPGGACAGERRRNTPFTSVADCAGHYFDRYRASYRHVNYVMSSEGTALLYYFND